MSLQRQSNLLRIRQLVSGGICVTIPVFWLFKATLPPAPSLPRAWTRWMLSLGLGEMMPYKWTKSQSEPGGCFFYAQPLPCHHVQKVGSEIVHIAFLLRIHFFISERCRRGNHADRKSEIFLDYEWFGDSVTSCLRHHFKSHCIREDDATRN